MSLPPFSLAFMGQRKPTGCASAMLQPMMRMQSLFCQILLIGGGRAATEGRPQTGDRGGVSNARLVFDGHDPQPRRKTVS